MDENAGNAMPSVAHTPSLEARVKTLEVEVARLSAVVAGVKDRVGADAMARALSTENR